MNRNVTALAAYLKKRPSEVDECWKQAKRMVRALGSGDNYVRCMKITLAMSKWGRTPQEAIPEEIGDGFRFMGTPSKLVAVDNTSWFVAEVGGVELTLPLITLTLCTSKKG